MTPGEATLRHLLEPIAEPLRHPDTTEIVIQEPGKVGIEQRGTWSWREVPEFTFAALDAIGILAGTLLSKDFDAAHPIVETTLPDGQRFTAIRPPITPLGTISITIRKPRQLVSTVHDDDFSALMDAARHHAEQSNPADEELLELYDARLWPRFFDLAVRSHKTIAATGRQWSGKTTWLKRVMQSIPSHERVVTIEDTDEFGALATKNRVSLIYGSAGVTAEQLIIVSLRMRADRVALQELRGPEAFAWLRIQTAGQTGGFATWHAGQDDPFMPLAVMVKSHPTGREIPDDKLLTLLRSLVDIVAYCRRDNSGFSVPSVYFRNAHARH
jgi:type IV secretion system protein VirB11